MPTFVPTFGIGTGGQAVAIPTALSGSTPQSVVIDRTDDAPFPLSLRIPLPTDGLSGQVVRVEQFTTLPTSVALPTGVTSAKIVQVDVYDLATGRVINDHLVPLEIAVQLDESEKALCRINPARIALVHIAADNAVTRVPLLAIDCDTGIMRALLSRTSASYAIASMVSSSSITFRVTLPWIHHYTGWPTP